jgi:large subunit ribosomal protein L6
MRKLSQITRNCFHKSYMFSGLDLPPFINFPSLPQGTWNYGSTEANNNYHQNSGLSQSVTSFPLMYTLRIPPFVSFQVVGTNEGSDLIFNSGRGDIRILIPSPFRCVLQKRTIILSIPDLTMSAQFKTLVGALYRAMLGVTKGYREKLKTVGRGYKGGFEKNRLMQLVLGYSHPIYYFLSPTIKVKFSRKNNRFNLQGPNSLIINQSAADLYSFKRPDVYKGKGIRYRGYKLLKKEGKKQKQ